MTNFNFIPAATALYTITFVDASGLTQRVASCFETPKAAHRFAKRITWGV